MKTFNKLPQYKKFISKRDHALEALLRNNQIKVDNELRAFFTKAIQICYQAFQSARKEQDQYQDIMILKRAEGEIEGMIPHFAHKISSLIFDLRKKVYTLTAASEAEAIGQATGKKALYMLPPDLSLRVKQDKAPSGLDWERKIVASLMSIKEKLKAQTYWLILNPETENEIALQYLIKKASS